MINLTVVIDNDEAVKKLKELQNVAKSTTSSVVKDSERMDASFQQMKNTLAGLAAGVSFAALAKQIVNVRGEVQQLEVAFETMLGSKEKASRLLAESIDLAAKTPFGLQEVSNATKMLLAYGSTAESVAEEIKMLGNIASGLSIPLNDMIYLYGTTRTQGRMFTQDLRQFMGRGIPLAEELAKQFGVTKDKVGELVTAGKVGFDEMAKALQAMTSEGGQFNNLMDKQSQTIAGQISNLEDAIYQMFNEIGESSEDVISDMISGASWVVEHYQSILKVLSPLIAAYGAYKTAIIVVAATQKAMALGRSIAMFIDLAKAITSAKDAMLLLNMATNANPLGILLSVLAAIGVAVWQFSKGTEDAARQMGALEKAAYDEYIEVNRLVNALKDTNLAEDERKDILGKLKEISPDIVTGLDNEATAMDTLTQNLKAYNDEQVKRIQLSSLQDTHNTKLTAMADAELQYKQMKAQMDAAISQLVADYKLTGKLPEIDTSWNSVYGEEEVAASLKKTLDEAIAGTLSGDRLANRLLAAVTPSGVMDETVKVKGFDIVGMTKQIGAYKNAYEDAQKVVEASSKNMQEMVALLGLAPEVAPEPTSPTGSKELTKEEKKEAEKRAKELASLRVKLQQDADQAVVDAMAEGTDKKIAQAELDWKRRKENIEASEKKIVELQGKALTKEQKDMFASLHKANAEAYATDVASVMFGEDADLSPAIKKLYADRKAWNDYIVEYGNFQEKIKATTERYNRLIAEADSEGRRKSLAAERDVLLAQYEVEAEGYAQTLINKTTEQLNKMVKELSAQVAEKEAAFQALDNTTGEEGDVLRKEIAKLQAQIAKLKERLGEAKNAVSDNKWAEATQVFQSIAKSAEEAAQGIAEFDERLAYALNGIAQLASLSIDVIGALEGVKTAFEKTGEAASAMEKASAILAVIGVAIKVVSGIFNIMKSNEEATRNATLAAYEYAQALREIANTNLRESFDTYFGKDNFGEFSALLEETKAQAKELDDIRKSFTKTTYKGDNSIIFNPNNVESPLVADMRSGWQKFWGTGNDNIKYTSLDEFYENGKLNVDKLKAYYDTYKEYLTEEQADLVKSLLDTGEMYEQNMEAINDYMRDIFGELGASITDSLVDAFRNGTDAAEAMGDAVGNVLEKIATDMAYAAFIQPLLEQAQADIDALNAKRDTMSYEEYMRQLMEISNTLMGNVMAQSDDVNAFLDNLQKAAKEQGVDIFESDTESQRATYGGFQTMSQETGSELNGRFTDIQGQTHRIAEAVEFCRALSASNLATVQSINATVASIHNDTSLIEKHTRALGQMSKDLNDIKIAVFDGAI